MNNDNDLIRRGDALDVFEGPDDCPVQFDYGEGRYRINALPAVTAPQGVLWEIEEYKIWKGLDADKPQWSGINVVCDDWDEAQGLLQYLSGNKPDAVLRVARSRHQRASLTPAQPAPDVPRPCHCGGTVHVDHFKNPKAVVIVCEQCGTEWLGYWSDSERSIIERWNSQPAPDAQDIRDWIDTLPKKPNAKLREAWAMYQAVVKKPAPAPTEWNAAIEAAAFLVSEMWDDPWELRTMILALRKGGDA